MSKKRLSIILALCICLISCNQSPTTDSSFESSKSSTMISDSSNETSTPSTNNETTSVTSVNTSNETSSNKASSSNSVDSSSEIKEISLLKTIDFEDITKGNMSANAHNIYYDGLIEADGKVSQTSSAKIDDNTLGMRLPINATNEERVLKIKSKGYSKILLDIKQERTYTKIQISDGQTFVGTKNGEIIRNVEIYVEGKEEISLIFSSETSISSTMDCGIDNIRFYGYGDPINEGNGEDNKEDINVDTPYVINGVITMKGIATFLETKQEHYPYSDEFIENYQQSSGGYIDYAKEKGILVDKSQHSPNQKWHFFDSWLYPSIEAGTLTWEASAKSRVYSKLICPELLLWIYEACGVEEAKVKQAMEVAFKGKNEGIATTTIAKNMREVVLWEDLETNIIKYINNLS